VTPKDRSEFSERELDVSEGYNASKILVWLIGVLGVLGTMGIAASVQMLVNTGERLTRMEATMEENKAERQRAVADLERRVTRIEDGMR
jgi:hypothetical protein